MVRSWKSNFLWKKYNTEHTSIGKGIITSFEIFTFYPPYYVGIGIKITEKVRVKKAAFSIHWCTFNKLAAAFIIDYFLSPFSFSFPFPPFTWIMVIIFDLYRFGKRVNNCSGKGWKGKSNGNRKKWRSTFALSPKSNNSVNSNCRKPRHCWPITMWIMKNSDQWDDSFCDSSVR